AASQAGSGESPSTLWKAANPHMGIPSDEAEALAEQERQVAPPVAPLLQLHLADARAIGDVRLAEGKPAEDGLELALLTERHAAGSDPEPVEDRAPEHPHAGLAVADRLQEQDRGDAGEHPVAEAIGRAHRAPVGEREAARREEV